MMDILETIHEFGDYAMDELNSASEYVDRAIAVKEWDDIVSENYMDLANEELSHYEKFMSMSRMAVEADGSDTATYIWNWISKILETRLRDINIRISMYSD